MIGAVLLEGRPTAARLLEVLGADDYYLDSHRIVWQTVRALTDAGQPIDILTVQEALTRADELEAAGGPAALAMILEQAMIPAHVDHYARLVKELGIKRGVAQRAQDLLDQALDASGPLELLASLEAAREATAGELGLVAPLAPSLGEVLAMTLEELRRGAPDVVPVPWPTLTRLLGGGLHPGEYVILGARPGLGKTALALLLAVHAARAGVPTLVISLEMALQALGRRVYAQQAHLSATALRRADLDAHELARLEATLQALAGLPAWLDETPVTLRRVEATSRRHIDRRRVRLVILDYLQLVGVPKARDTRERIETVSRGLKLLAHARGVVVVALCSLARTPDGKGGDREPGLSDLRESGQLEHDADWVWLLHRPPKAKRAEREDPTRLVLKVAKGRDGATGRLEFVFSPPILTLEERETDREEVPF